MANYHFEPEDQSSAQDNNPDGLEVLSGGAVEALERASIDMQISTAKKYPRDIRKVKDRMLAFATMDVETAGTCFYTLKRKGDGGKEKFIHGPSIRLAEIATVSYQNLRAGARVIENDGKRITAQGVCHDLENNVLVAMASQVGITKRNGQTYSEDMQTMVGNAAVAKAFRNSVFKVIPLALVKPVYEKAMEVAGDNSTPLGARWQVAVAKFSEMSVTEAQLLAWLDKTAPEELTGTDIVNLRGLFTSIRDGDERIEDAFAGIDPRTGARTATGKEAAETNIAEKIREQRKQQDASRVTREDLEQVSRVREKLSGGNVTKEDLDQILSDLPTEEPPTEDENDKVAKAYDKQAKKGFSLK